MKNFDKIYENEYVDNSGIDLKATVIAVDPVHLYVLCPFCGKVHIHGSNGVIDSGNYGHRFAHCKKKHFGGYNLKSNKSTIRSEYEITAKSETILKRYHQLCGDGMWFTVRRYKR
jgi:hypothetical protein